MMQQNPHNSAASPTLLTFALIIGVLATSFSAIFLNMALPTMIADLGIDTAHSHWLISVYILASTLSMLLASHLVSKYSMRNTFAFFLLLFIGASLFGALLSSFWPIVICRMLQGSSLGVLSVVAMIALFDAYPIERRGHAGAIFGLGLAAGPTLGPTLSGIVVEWWGWRATFLAPLPLAITSLVLCWKMLPSKVVSSTKNLDRMGLVILTITLFGALFGLSHLQEYQWPIKDTLLFAGSLFILLAILWVHQKRNSEPLLLLGLFSHTAFNSAAIVAFVYGMGLWGSAFILPMYLQQAIHLSAWDAGMVMLPSGLLLCVVLPLGGRMVDTFPARPVVASGLAALAISFLLLGFGVAGSSFFLIALLIAISRGLGLGIMIPSLDATATRTLPEDQMAEGIAMMNFLRNLGGALAPTLLMIVLQWRTNANANAGTADNGLAAGYNQTLLVLGFLFLISILATRKLQVRD